MKKIAKKSLSLILAVSALCILFAFQASALTTNCPECGAECSYNRLPMDPRHECVCPTHGAFYEEDCEVVNFHDGTHGCPCGRWTESHNYGDWIDNGINGHIRYCTVAGCDASQTSPHNYVNGVCTVCGRPTH